MKADRKLEKIGSLVKEWIEENNPFEDEGLYALDIKAMYLVGSRAKGTHRPDSDYDVAVVFENCPDGEQLSAIKLSDALHQRLGSDMPEFRGCTLDIQIFFDTDPELDAYSKIDLQAGCDPVVARSTSGPKIGLL